MRQNLNVMLTGMRGTGKSTALREMLDKTKKKIVVYAPDASPVFHDYAVVHPLLLPKWKSGNILITHKDKELVLEQLNQLTNCTMVLDDLMKYIPTTIPQAFRDILLSSKQRNVDVMLTVHGFRGTHPELFNFCNVMEVFKTSDDERHIKTLTKIPNLNGVLDVWRNVMQHESRYFHKTVTIE